MRWYLLDISTLTEDEYQKWYWLMDRNKRKRTDAFCFVEDKKRTVFSEMLARLALAKMAGCAPESIAFSMLPGGKPYAQGLNLEHNISHCDRWVACIVSDKPIGIDLEQICPVPDRLVRYVCTEQEYAFVIGKNTTQSVDILTDRGALERFFQVWTAKEAFAKYTGTGLAQNIKEIPWKDSSVHCVILDECVLSICCAPGYTGAVTQGDVRELWNTPHKGTI